MSPLLDFTKPSPFKASCLLLNIVKLAGDNNPRAVVDAVGILKV